MAASSLGVSRCGSGPTLLMLHGIGSSRTAWDLQFARLGNAFTCIAPDLPGYGDSPDPAGPGLAPIVDAVAALIADQAVHVIGVSFGGLVSLALAHRYPARVTSLVLADATLGRARAAHDERERWLKHRHALAQDLASRSHERAREIAAPDAADDVVEAIAAHMRRARPAGYLAVADAIATTDAMPWLSDIHHPALVVCGQHDSVTGSKLSRVLATSLPDARFVEMPGAGHAPHIEQPDRFAEIVSGFLDGIATSTTALTQR